MITAKHGGLSTKIMKQEEMSATKKHGKKNSLSRE
jgi:hypothetical protein